VVLVTHQMEEVERLCDRIMLLKDGRRYLYGAVDDIRTEYGSDVITVEFSGALPKVPAYYTIKDQNRRSAQLVPAAGVKPSEILRELAGHRGLALSRFEVMRASLDDIFVDIYSRPDERREQQ
jgi:ABC-2 type transport system ATP-binding protein